MSEGRRELRISTASGVFSQAAVPVSFVALLSTLLAAKILEPDFAGLVLIATAFGVFQVAFMLVLLRFDRPGVLVVDADFIRYEEEGQTRWETGWADLAEIRIDSDQWTLIDQMDRKFKVKRPAAPWPFAVLALTRPGVICTPVERVAKGKGILGRAIILALLPPVLITTFSLAFGINLSLPLVLSVAAGVILLGAGFLAKHLDRHQAKGASMDIRRWVLGERTACAADLYPIRAILDDQPQAFVYQGSQPKLQGARIYFRDGDIQVEGADFVPEAQLTDFVEESK